MSTKQPQQSWVKPIPELKYLNAENVHRYRLIMRYFYQQYQRLRYWLKPEEVYQGVMRYGLLPEYTLEQCQQDLQVLTEWKNLTVRHDGGRAATIEEYLRKKFRYLLTPYSIEIERMLENLENLQGYGGSLEPTLFDKIAGLLKEIADRNDRFAPDEALQIWKELSQSFKQLHENASDYLASLQSGRAEELMMTEAFLVFKDTLTHYLRNFIHALQKSSYAIEGYLQQLSGPGESRFIACVVADQERVPHLEDTRTHEERLEQVQAEWSSFRRWFLGDGHEPSDLYYLEQATKETISRVVRCALRIQEKRRIGVSRKRELDHLGQWFFRLDDLEEAKKLAAYVFGLYPTRHFHGWDDEGDGSGQQSMWEEAPMTASLRSRSRKQVRGGQSEPVRQTKEQQKQARQRYLEKKREEEAMIGRLIERGSFRLSELDELSVPMRKMLLYWISRCLSSPSRTFHTPDGIQVEMKFPEDGARTALRAEDGVLELPDFQFAVGSAKSMGTASGGRQKELQTAGGARRR
ncbi:TIGR02677 family protein [Bacillaceae bacterium]